MLLIADPVRIDIGVAGGILRVVPTFCPLPEMPNQLLPSMLAAIRPPGMPPTPPVVTLVTLPLTVVVVTVVCCGACEPVGILLTVVVVVHVSVSLLPAQSASPSGRLC